jgi:hypothetical protein
MCKELFHSRMMKVLEIMRGETVLFGKSHHYQYFSNKENY